jgi:hypothetical protein
MRYLSILVFAVAALRADAAMVRVVEVVDGRTVVVERGAARETVRLAGLEVTDEIRARDLLRWTAVGAWVMLEPAEGGAFLVYRSPDAMFLNRELVMRGFARSTIAGLEPDLRPPSRYLGELNLPPKEKAQRERATPRSDRKGSGTSRRSTTSPSRRAPARSNRGRSSTGPG